MRAETEVFAVEKRGSSESEWEDGAGASFRPCDALGPGTGRYIVVDGATEAFDAIRWVDHIVSSFLDDLDRVPLTKDGARAWFGRLQRMWQDCAPTGLNYYEERKFEEGSYATLLCCELVDVGGTRPRLRMASLGDAVLFHVRDGALLSHFPPLSVDDFGSAPDGVHTSPDRLDHMVESLTFADTELAIGDLLLLATDAFARWVLSSCGAGDARPLWALLEDLGQPAVFRELVDDQRDSGAMQNDDVTLLRVRLVPEPGPLVGSP